MSYDLEMLHIEMRCRGIIRRLQKIKPKEYDGWCPCTESPSQAYYWKMGRTLDLLESVMKFNE